MSTVLVAVIVALAACVAMVFLQDFARITELFVGYDTFYVAHLVGNGSDKTLREDAYSSLFCEGDSFATRRCEVTNLCYLPGEGRFVFAYSEQHTRYVGVKGAADLNPLLKLNPVVDHNAFDLSLVPVSPAWLHKQGAVLHRGSFLLLEPFKPDNVMHALHDDLLPVYATLVHMCRGDVLRCAGVRWRLLLHGELPPALTAPLYTALSPAPPVFTGNFPIDRPQCFQRAHLGLRADTLWYQYGFSQPQAPLPGAHVQSEMLVDFANFVRKRLASSDIGAGVVKEKYVVFDTGNSNRVGVDGKDELSEDEINQLFSGNVATVADPSVEHVDETGYQDHGNDAGELSAPISADSDIAATGQYILLISRTQSRRILNEAELADALALRLGLPVRRLALEEVGVTAAVYHVSGAALLVAVHGSALALAAFLPRGAAVLELLPFGLNPALYRPYQRLCHLRRLRYRAWRNLDPSASAAPPEDAAPDLGGLAHLSAEEQQRVRELTEVPAALCCHDPAFLYRVYQDTLVDVAAVAEVAAGAMRRRPETRPVAPLWFPGPVRNVTAFTDDQTRTVTWEPPLAAPGRLRYRVWVQQASRLSQHVTSELGLEVATDGVDRTLLVWIRADMGVRQGVLTHHQFQTTPEA